MFKHNKRTVSVAMPRAALEAIFDECDRYDADETGGRLIGTYRRNDGHYEIQVLGMIEPGPNARRTPTSFFQDGDHQEQVFRMIETSHPEIEHLGNWHTHHVNGYPTLSGGDKSTYFNIVNHQQHNTDFFYALLVVKKNAAGNPRYEVKHFLFRRNDKSVYEIQDAQVRIADAPTLWPRKSPPANPGLTVNQNDAPPARSAANPQRAKDQELFADFYPSLKAMKSSRTGILYWKGPITLVDGSRVDVVAAESNGDGKARYSIGASAANPIYDSVVSSYKERIFHSARHAVIQFEHDLNRALYTGKKGS